MALTFEPLFGDYDVAGGPYAECVHPVKWVGGGQEVPLEFRDGAADFGKSDAGASDEEDDA